jgi:hypothetical protein
MWLPLQLIVCFTAKKITWYNIPNFIMGSTTSNAANQTTNNASSSASDLTGVVFNKTNYIFILWFLAIYVVAYFFIGFFFKKTDEGTSFLLRISRGIDFIVLIGLLIFQSFSSFVLAANQELIKDHPSIIYFLTIF